MRPDEFDILMTTIHSQYTCIDIFSNSSTSGSFVFGYLSSHIPRLGSDEKDNRDDEVFQKAG